MPRRLRVSAGSALVVLTLLAAMGAVPAFGGFGPAAPERRPDLVQRPPSSVTTRERDGRHLLGFDAAVQNHGDGPLLVEGRRTPPTREMTARQTVERADGSVAIVPNVGRIRYTRSGGHDHWHFLKAVRYELRRASDHALVRPDRKTGFCLGDRYDTRLSFPRKPPRAVLTGNCRLYQPGARTVDMGISVGYGDDYRAYLEGQSIDVTRVPPGLYELVHRANPGRRLRERTISNNVSSVLLRIAWPRGVGERPAVRVLKQCPRRERCLP